MQVRLMKLMSKIEYLIVPKGTEKITGPGKLGNHPGWAYVTYGLWGDRNFGL